MRARHSETGSVLLIAVVLVALLAATVAGHLQVNAEEIQLMQNHVNGVAALAVAEAGLNDAFAHLRADSGWNAGFVGKPFNGGSYSVAVDGSTVTSTASTSHEFVARMEAEITVSSEGPPYHIRIDRLRVNE